MPNPPPPGQNLSQPLPRIYICNSTVKLGYNELGYKELSVITNKKQWLVGSGKFIYNFSRL